MIRDEFSGLKISRQYRWQLRKSKQKLCRICAKALTTKYYCRAHADKSIERALRYYYDGKSAGKETK